MPGRIEFRENGGGPDPLNGWMLPPNLGLCFVRGPHLNPIMLHSLGSKLWVPATPQLAVDIRPPGLGVALRGPTCAQLQDLVGTGSHHPPAEQGRGCTQALRVCASAGERGEPGSKAWEAPWSLFRVDFIMIPLL